MKQESTSPHGKPVLDERTFQQLLLAVYTLQQHHDRVLMKEPESDYAALSPTGIVNHFWPTPLLPLTPGTPHSVRPLGSVPWQAQAEVGTLAAQCDSLIPPETAYQLSALASQLDALIPREIQTEWTIPQAPSVEHETLLGEQQDNDHSMEVLGQSVLEQPGSELTGLTPLVPPAVPSGTNIFPFRAVRRPTPWSNESFWRTSTVVAIAAILSLLGASVHRVSPLPAGLSQPSEGVQQQVPFQRTVPVVTVFASDQKPAVTPNRLDSTSGIAADLVAEDTVVRYNRRVASSGVQAQKKQ